MYNLTESPETEAPTENQLFAITVELVSITEIVFDPVVSVKTESCKKSSHPVVPLLLDAITFFPVKLAGLIKAVIVIESVCRSSGLPAFA